MYKRFSLLVILVIFTLCFVMISPLKAEETKFKIWVDYWGTNLSSKVEYKGDNVDLVDDIELPRYKDIPAFGISYFWNEKNGMMLSYWESSYKGSTDKSFEFGDTKFIFVEQQDFTDCTLIVGWHGLGECGFLSVNHLVEKLNAKRIGLILTKNIPQYITIRKQAISYPLELYRSDNIILLLPLFEPNKSDHISLAKGIGTLKKGAVWVSFKQEAELDLFNEQGFGPAFGLVLLNAIYTLIEAGYPPEAVLIEMYMSGEMSYTYKKMADFGIIKQLDFHSQTSQYGAMSRGIRYRKLPVKKITIMSFQLYLIKPICLITANH